jgi:hypothetical protein
VNNDPFTTARDDLIAQIAAAQTEVGPLRAAVEALKGEDEAAGVRLYQISSRASRAVLITDEGASPLVGIVEEARRERNIVAGRLTLARRLLANAEWRLEVLSSDLEQLARAITQPPIEHRPVVVKRPTPAAFDVVSDPTVFPAGTRPATAAAEVA